jgi:molecular chaperone DnaK
MSKIVGIDLGTTNSLVATVDSGIPLVIADPEGRRLTPSVVHFPAGDAEPVVGYAANRVRVVKPAETVYSVKRFIGRRGADISQEEMLVTYPVKGEAAGPVRIPIHGRHFLPEEISAEVLKKLKRDAEAALGEPVTRAVITVPAYFNDAQRNATKKAGELAGFTVERIINEPTAAALAYGLDKLKEKSKIAVYDLGGGTFDLSILELTEGVFQVLAANGNTRLGGDDLDRRIVDFLVERIRERAASILPAEPFRALESQNCQQDAGSTLAILSRIREAAEQAKIKLSTEAEVEIALPFLTPDFSFSCKLTRAELESLTHDIILRTRQHCLRALADAKIQPKELDQVILVGGQTRMPLVRQLVTEWFGCAEFEETRGGVRVRTDYHRPSGPQLNTSQNPDEAVALGGDSANPLRRFSARVVADRDAASLGRDLWRFDERHHPAQFDDSSEGWRDVHDRRGQSARCSFTCCRANVSAPGNWVLANLRWSLNQRRAGRARACNLKLTPTVFYTSSRDTETARKNRGDEVRRGRDDAAVQQMMEESVEHAFEDSPRGGGLKRS